MKEKQKIGVISLGCSKNRVDSEVMMGYLTRTGYEITNDPKAANILIVNTCGFIESAKQESINTILEMAAYKTAGVCQKLVVTGCLSERYRKELPSELPEVDLWLGVREYEKLPALLKGTGGAAPAYPWGQRVLSTPAHYAYLRIADGCDNRCAYCAIPGIRGNYVSRPVEELAEEAEALAERGVKELYVIAQDTTRYGFDRYGKAMLPELLQRLNAIPGLVWIRLLYAYPDTLTPQVLDTMAECEKVVKYIDLPLQHADDGVLRSMNRRGNAAHYAALIDELRRRDPAYVLRTTYMVGFPTETEERFEALCRFAQEHPFDRVGVFTYSPEEGTPAEPLGDPVPQEEKERRAAKLMRLQQKISLAFHQARVGKTYDVLVDGADERSGLLIGRTYGEAAEIDGVVAFVPNTQHAPGDLARVKITEAREYDLFGEETKR